MRAVCVLLLLSGWTVAQGQQVSLAPGGPDAAAYGEAAGYPAGDSRTLFEQKDMVGSFSHFDSIFPARVVKAAPKSWPFRRSAPLGEIRYIHGGKQYSLVDYLSRLPITGLLVAKDDLILTENYQYGRTDRDRLTSQSMAKTIVSMLVGEAIAEHKVASVNDAASKYVPELKDSAYGAVSILDLLQMSSGVACRETADPGDGFTMSWVMGVNRIAHDCTRRTSAGTRFHYSGTDSEVLGLIVSRAVHMPLARYLEETIWKQIGTEADATWNTGPSGLETPFCCFNAVLRDYARFGRLLAYDGTWEGKQLIPKQWVLDATTVNSSDSRLAPGTVNRFLGYGYHVWILPGPRRMVCLLGANGQRIFVDPKSKLVMVQTAVEKEAVGPEDAETVALWFALVRRFGRE